MISVNRNTINNEIVKSPNNISKANLPQTTNTYSDTEPKEFLGVLNKESKALISKSVSFVDNKSAKGLATPEKIIAEKLTSLFENSSFDLKYDYAEALGDGRGITAGRAGFTTATGDLLDVVKKYTHLKPHNILQKYLPELEKLAKSESADTHKLKGLVQDWSKASKDPDFKKVQDQVVDETYYSPAMNYCEKLGLNSNISKAIIYDTIIQHGEGDDPDGLKAIINSTEKKMGGKPKSLEQEKKWIQTFIAERRKILAHAHDPETRSVWADSVGRCDAFSYLLKNNNYNLSLPIKLNTKDYKTEIKE